MERMYALCCLKNILSGVSGLLRPEGRVLPWRRPECVTAAGSLQRLPELLADAGCKEPMIVASAANAPHRNLLPWRRGFRPGAASTASRRRPAWTPDPCGGAYIGRFITPGRPEALPGSGRGHYRMNRALGIPECFPVFGRRTCLKWPPGRRPTPYTRCR